ncbi:Calcium-binding component of the spindle pole body (SPB) half-bridge [Tritrichomonas musculus]|uniref:Calcium-binding component of the spindle pole body (SPB) half-bridge n=1 Tax=Tritrichomonas musculus TaxID=1915356 RepID=A0ABR2IQZ7_9EUKA
MNPSSKVSNSPRPARKSPRSKSNRQLTRDQLREIREAFDIFNTDNSDTIDRHEFHVAVNAMGLDVSKKEILDIFDQYDATGRAGLNRDQFEEIMSIKMLERDPLYEPQRKFKLLDNDSTGKISLKNLKHAIGEIQRNMTDELLLRKKKNLSEMTNDEIENLSQRDIEIRKDEEETARFINSLLTMKDSDLQAMISEFDLDGDGQINYNEFLNILNPNGA